MDKQLMEYFAAEFKKKEKLDVLTNLKAKYKLWESVQKVRSERFG